MAVVHGYNAFLGIQPFGDNTIKDISGESNEVTLTIDNPAADVTGFGSVAKSFVVGQYSWSLDARGWYTGGGGTGITDRVLGSLSAQAGTTRIRYALNGSAATETLYGGGGYVISTGRTANLGGGVGWTMRFQGSGTLGLGTCG